MKRALGALAFLLGFVALLAASDHIERNTPQHYANGAPDMTEVDLVARTECAVWHAEMFSGHATRRECRHLAANEWRPQ